MNGHLHSLSSDGCTWRSALEEVAVTWTLSDLQSVGTRSVSLGVAVGARRPQADKGRRGQRPHRQRKLRLEALCAVSPVCARSIHAAAVPGLPPFLGCVILPLTDHTALARSSVGGRLGRCHLSALVTRAALNKGWSPSLSSPECPPRSRIAVSRQRCFCIHHMPATVLPRSPGGRTPVSCRGHVPLLHPTR